ncbi:MAG: hypothetical protein ACJAUG_003403 [Halioglobus sp.]|jgi:hypothetical protein
MEILEWQGVAMMEYKRDPESDQFWLIEINARYWGYLDQDLYSRKNFPETPGGRIFWRSSRGYDASD